LQIYHQLTNETELNVYLVQHAIMKPIKACLISLIENKARAHQIPKNKSFLNTNDIVDDGVENRPNPFVTPTSTPVYTANTPTKIKSC